MELFTGFDLHAKSSSIGIVNAYGKRPSLLICAPRLAIFLQSRPNI